MVIDILKVIVGLIVAIFLLYLVARVIGAGVAKSWFETKEKNGGTNEKEK